MTTVVIYGVVQPLRIGDGQVEFQVFFCAFARVFGRVGIGVWGRGAVCVTLWCGGEDVNECRTGNRSAGDGNHWTKFLGPGVW